MDGVFTQKKKCRATDERKGSKWKPELFENRVGYLEKALHNVLSGFFIALIAGNSP